MLQFEFTYLKLKAIRRDFNFISAFFFFFFLCLARWIILFHPFLSQYMKQDILFQALDKFLGVWKIWSTDCIEKSVLINHRVILTHIWFTFWLLYKFHANEKLFSIRSRKCRYLLNEISIKSYFTKCSTPVWQR